MSVTFTDGNTLRDQLNSVWRQTGIKPKELEELLELPESCQHVWKWFLDLHSARTSSGFAPNPITYSDMYSYFTLLSMYPEEWELDLIKLIDRESLAVAAKEIEKKSNSK